MAKLVLALIKIDGGHNLLGSNFGIYKAPWQHGRSQDGITVGKESKGNSLGGKEDEELGGQKEWLKSVVEEDQGDCKQKKEDKSRKKRSWKQNN